MEKSSCDSNSDLNNYRGISVLSPLAKIFEKLLAAQINDYFENNNLIYKGQHPFRLGHSCESALQELISDKNVDRDAKLSSLLLFIDFKKAFDTVNSNLLLLKLFHYGFDNDSLKLITDYFRERSQSTKLGKILSRSESINLGVPQGSF